jgi:DNA polymerase elongation subunit (family B)
MNSLFIYSWHQDETQKEVTSIRIYGLSKTNKNVCLRVDDFTPYVYVELPTFITWTQSKAQVVVQKINSMLGRAKPLKSSLVMRRKLYYAYLDSNGNHEEFPFLFLAFSSKSDINILSWKLKDAISIPQIGNIKLKMHEQKASPALQLQCFCDIPSAGWASFKGTQVSEDEKITSCDFEYYVGWKNLMTYESDDVVNPYVMCYDLEVNSSNPDKMPTVTNPKDKIFQMSCVFFRVGSTKYEKYLFSLFDPNPEIVGDDTIVVKCDTESDILEKYANIINEKQPNIISGYNIFKFDIPYMIDRAKLCRVIDIFSKHGFSKYEQAKEKTIKWSSKAYKNSEFSYMDADGRLFIDLLPLIQRDYKFSSYSLKFVSDYFISETKDPLTPKGIFKCYQLAVDGGEQGRKAMGICGKYCVQDSILVAKLFGILQTWFGLSEMAKICNVSMFELYTQGQQKKVYSQVYKFCMAENIVVESDGYISKEDDHYQGAHVFEPIPGVYDCVVPFDFASLYPSIIIAYNIDFTTLIPDNSTIPDSDCNIVEWSEHVSCEHDTVKRKSKSKYKLCGDKCFKFLKTHRGVLPTLLVNLLDARKKTRGIMKDITKKLDTSSEEEKEKLQTLYNVLDKRQLSYKISANSMYGALGVHSGYLPLMPAAMCVTAVGRKSILKVADTITNEYGARIILGDTDSVYCIFDKFGKDTRAIWNWCEKVSDEISKLFPKPMKLEFEEVIYWRFLTLTKKRYMSIKCDKEGNISNKMTKKGVLLTRRDNSNFVRTVYESCITKIFNQEDKDEIIYSIVQQFNKLYSNSFEYKDFIITKSIGSTTIDEDGKVFVAPLSSTKGMVGDYKVPLLAEEGSAKRMSQFLLKKATTEDEYYLRCLPSQVQLGEKMKKRGQRVDSGSRLEFLVVRTQIAKPKLYEHLENWDYFKDRTGVLKIDFGYYLKAIATQLDQVLSCTVGISTFGKEQLDIRKKKQKMIDQLNVLSRPKIIVENTSMFIIEEE